MVKLIKQADMVEIVVQAMGWDAVAKGAVTAEGTVRVDIQWDNLFPNRSFQPPGVSASLSPHFRSRMGSQGVTPHDISSRRRV